MPATHPFAVKLDPEVRERVPAFAKARDRSIHWLLREAIAHYVEREEKRESFRHNGLRAWAEYQATGQHVTQDEADAWLAELETGRGKDPPECHD